MQSRFVQLKNKYWAVRLKPQTTDICALSAIRHVLNVIVRGCGPLRPFARPANGWIWSCAARHSAPATTRPAAMRHCGLRASGHGRSHANAWQKASPSGSSDASVPSCWKGCLSGEPATSPLLAWPSITRWRSPVLGCVPRVSLP